MEHEVNGQRMLRSKRKALWTLALAGIVSLATLATSACSDDETTAPQPTSTTGGAGGQAGTTHVGGGGSSAGGAGGEAPVPTPQCDEPTGHRYYVSPDGDDSHPGTEEQPWLSLQHAADTVEPGDGVIIATGTYPERVVIDKAGTAEAPIIFTAAPAAEVTIEGAGITLDSAEGLVQIGSEASYVQLCGLNIHGSTARGVMVSRADHVSLIGLEVVDSGQAAILVYSSSDVLVHGNKTRESVSSGVGVWQSTGVVVRDNQIVNARNSETLGSQESLSIADTEDFEVSGNEITLEGPNAFIGNAGIDVKESSRLGKVHHNYIHDFTHDGAIYLDAWMAGLNGDETLHDVDVYDNLLVDSGGITVGSERGGTAENINIYNNVLIRSSHVGIAIAEIHAGAQGPGWRRNIAIYNNTIYLAGGHGGAGIYLVAQAVENISVQNNVVAFGDEYWVGQITAATDSILGELTVDHNLVFGRTECSQAYPDCVELSETMPNNITADPLFVDPASGDLHLLAGSPAIDSGVDIPSLTADHEGNPRPQGAAMDMGAFETAP